MQFPSENLKTRHKAQRFFKIPVFYGRFEGKEQAYSRALRANFTNANVFITTTSARNYWELCKNGKKYARSAASKHYHRPLSRHVSREPRTTLQIKTEGNIKFIALFTESLFQSQD